MSLLVWLPLQGDLNNQGTSGPISNTGLTSGNSWDTDAKIGGQSLKMTKSQTIFPTNSIMSGAKQFTTCYWVKVNEAWTTNWLDGFRWISTNGESTATGRQEFYTNCTKIGVWYSGGSNSNKTGYVGEWMHLAISVDYDTGICKFYRNGTLIGTTTNVNKAHYCRGDFYIGDSGVNICMNDFRLYNNILTAAEIKEIARGMVVHYKLDGAYGYPTNILNDTNVNTTAKVKASYARYFESAGGGTYTAVFEEIPDPPVSGIKYGIHQTVTAASGFHSLVWYSGANVGVTIGVPYTMSCYVKWINGENATLKFQYGKSPYRSTTIAINKDGQWHQYSWTFTPDSSAAASNTTKIYCGGLSTVGEILICGYKLERGTVATPWCESASNMPFWSDLNYKIVDSSGYGHHGTLVGTRRFASGSARYNCCEYIGSGVTDHISTTGLNLPQFPLTACIWFKSTNTTPTGDYHQPFNLRSADNTKSMGIFVYKTGPFRGGVTANGANSWANVNGTNALDGEWHFCAITYDGETLKKYFDGELGASTAVANTGDAAILDSLYIGSYPSQYGCVDTYLSDFRLYSTVLLDTDIKMLYNTSMRIDKNYNAHIFQALQTRENLFARAEIARAAGKGMNTSVGLYNFHQNNCQVTCDERGFRIYRPPDLAAGSGNKTFGGLVLRNSTSTSIHVYNPEKDNIFGLINGHTYVWAMTISGHTHSVPTFTINNNTGYVSNAARGLNTAPTNVKQHNLPTDFDGTQEVFYRFTISDTIVKTCTQSYSNFVEGNDYLAYMDFAWRWDYLATGEQGTEVYVSNLRLYDITDMPDFTIGKDGVVRAQDFIEADYGTKIQFDSEFLANEIIER